MSRLGLPLLTAHTVKFFADGVIENEPSPCWSRTAAPHGHGMQVWDRRRSPMPLRVDALGFQPHIHAIGDAAVRRAWMPSSTSPPPTGRATDARSSPMPSWSTPRTSRFAELGVIANMQPLWAQLDAFMVELTIPRLGPERGAKQYRMDSLDESPALPVVRLGLAGVVGRSAEGNRGGGVAEGKKKRGGGWTPQEILSVERALSAYTAGVAEQAFAEGLMGAQSHPARAPTGCGSTAIRGPRPI